jgi:hypothetical protein
MHQIYAFQLIKSLQWYSGQKSWKSKKKKKKNCENCKRAGKKIFVKPVKEPKKPNTMP